MKTVRKALRILRLFSTETPELGVTAIAQRLEIDPASAHRLLRAMLAERFIEQDPRSRLYRIGLGVLDVAAVRLGARGLLDVAVPHLEALRDETGETVALLTTDGTEAICLAAVESRHPVRVGYSIGERFPLHASAGGQVLLAHLVAADRQALYARGLRRFTPKTLVDAATLEARCIAIRAQGGGFAEDSYIEGVLTAAAPVMDPKRLLAGAISLAVPAQRCDLPRLERHWLAVREAATRIERAWAGMTPQDEMRIMNPD